MSETNTPKPENRMQKDISSLTISELLSVLKPAQLWIILTVIFAVLSGTFGLGYKLNDFLAQSEAVNYQTEIAALKIKIMQFRAIQTKERFLALYLRYSMAKAAADVSAESQEAINVAKSNLKSYIEELLQRGEEASDEIDLRGLFLGKGGGKNATVKFGYDGSVWDLPPEFGFAAKMG